MQNKKYPQFIPEYRQLYRVADTYLGSMHLGHGHERDRPARPKTGQNMTDVVVTQPRQKTKRIPVCTPTLDGNERAYVLDCIETNWISSLGSYLPRFEETFSQLCGTQHGVSCSSGTAAIHLALEALNIGPGDEVIIPSFTLIVSANMVCLTGATPVLVDVRRRIS